MTQVVLALLIGSAPARADEPLRASLDYAILAQPYQNSVRLNTSGVDTRIAVDRDPSSLYFGTIYTVSDTSSYFCDAGGQCLSDGNITGYRSLDGGRTFGGPFSLGLCSAGNTTYCVEGVNRPDIAVGNNGVVYVAAGSTIVRSLDQGLSWQTVASFKNFGSSASIATEDATGAVYVADVNSSKIVLVTRSLDKGQTWSSPITVSGGATGSIPQMAAFRDSVLVAFLSGSGSPAYVTVAASHDGGRTWPIITAVSPQKLCYSASPSMTVSL